MLDLFCAVSLSVGQAARTAAAAGAAAKTKENPLIIVFSIETSEKQNLEVNLKWSQPVSLSKYNYQILYQMPMEEMCYTQHVKLSHT